MDAVQRMRKKAKDTGNLKSREQQKVETKTVESKQVIVVEQANPQVVYVPSYNPTVVYGAPVYAYPPIAYPPPGYYAAGMAISFGVGVAMGAMWGGGWATMRMGGNNNVTINNNNNFVNNSNRQHQWRQPQRQWQGTRGGTAIGSTTRSIAAEPLTATGHGQQVRRHDTWRLHANRQANARQNRRDSNRQRPAAGMEIRGAVPVQVIATSTGNRGRGRGQHAQPWRRGLNGGEGTAWATSESRILQAPPTVARLVGRQWHERQRSSSQQFAWRFQLWGLTRAVGPWRRRSRRRWRRRR